MKKSTFEKKVIGLSINDKIKVKFKNGKSEIYHGLPFNPFVYEYIIYLVKLKRFKGKLVSYKLHAVYFKDIKSISKF